MKLHFAGIIMNKFKSPTAIETITVSTMKADGATAAGLKVAGPQPFCP
jgi:hypothetical protein